MIVEKRWRKLERNKWKWEINLYVDCEYSVKSSQRSYLLSTSPTMNPFEQSSANVDGSVNVYERNDNKE